MFRREPMNSQSSAGSGRTPLTYRDILFEANGRRRTRSEAEELYGIRAVDVAEIFEALQPLRELPAHLSLPPRVFISYRWGDDQENRWVDNLALELRTRGYEVFLTSITNQPLRKATRWERLYRKWRHV